MKEIKSLTKNVFAYGIGQGINKFAGIILLPFYTRALTPSDYGILETIGVGIFFISAILNVGADSASARYFYMAKTDEDKGMVLFNTLVFRILSVIPSLIIAVFSKQISQAVFGTELYTWVIFISCMIMPFQLLYSEQEHIYRYYFEPWKFNLISFIKLISYIVLGIWLVVELGKGILGAQASILISSFLLFIFSFLLFNRKRYTYRFSWYWAKRMLKFGFPLIFAGVASWFYIASDRYFLLYYKTTTDIGLYSVGAKLAQIMIILTMAVQMSWGPIIVSVFENDKDSEKKVTKDLLSQGWRLFLAVSLSLALFISIFGPEIIKLFTPPAYHMGAIVIPFLVLSTVCFQSVQMTSSGINLFEKTKHFAWIIPVVSLVSVGLNFYMVPNYSYIGAACTNLIANLVQIIITYNISQKYFFVDRKIKSVLIYSFIIVSISILFPVLELIYGIKISLLLKSVTFLICLSLPFVTGTIGFQSIQDLIQKNRAKSV